MIDVHSHIIFDVDDGPKSIEDSRALLLEAYDQGIRTIVSTSHRRQGMFETPEDKIAENFRAVQKIARDIADDLTILYGAEIYYTQDIINKLEKKTFPTLNGSRYALIEFSSETSYRSIHSALQQLLLSGITPLIAHIERYDALENNKQAVLELIRMGCYTQINSSHLLRKKLFKDDAKIMKKRVHYFLKHDLVHIVASDMHNLDTRPPYMAEAYEIISKRYGKEKAEEFFIKNPQRILMDQLI